MVRSKLRGVGDTVRERAPSPPSGPDVELGSRLPDESALRRAATVTALAGAGLTVLGLLVRYLLGRRKPKVGEGAPKWTAARERTHTSDWEGPRVAPLVGVVALVVMRVYVERVGEVVDRGT